MFIVFVDFKDPKYGDKCREVIKTLTDIAPIFEMHFKIFYADANDP